MARLFHEAPATTGASPSPHRAPEVVPCNPALLRLALARRPLLLQGPVGPFFDRLTRWLRGNGSEVHRIALQPGDRCDCRELTPIDYTGTQADWPAFLSTTIARLRIDCVVLFGQARPHHAEAVKLAQALRLPVVVLEEGYVRPGYITMELDGVNGFSTTLERYHWNVDTPGATVRAKKPADTGHQFRQMGWYACRHYWAQHWGTPLSPDYRHHRPTNIWRHSHYWVWSWLRKHLHLARDNRRVNALTQRDYYFVPLQHDGDSQITHHSRFGTNSGFVMEVLNSFAQHAPAGTELVFRMHPHSRGGRGDAGLIASLAARLGVSERVHHLIEGHTPTLVKHARGVVLINSTVGLQALRRRRPLMVMGDALYARPGLCFQGPLERFWREGTPPDDEFAGSFLEQLIALTQVPCNVYGLTDEPLLWTLHLLPDSPSEP